MFVRKGDLEGRVSSPNGPPIVRPGRLNGKLGFPKPHARQSQMEFSTSQRTGLNWTSLKVTGKIKGPSRQQQRDLLPLVRLARLGEPHLSGAALCPERVECRRAGG